MRWATVLVFISTFFFPAQCLCAVEPPAASAAGEHHDCDQQKTSNESDRPCANQECCLVPCIEGRSNPEQAVVLIEVDYKFEKLSADFSVSPNETKRFFHTVRSVSGVDPPDLSFSFSTTLLKLLQRWLI